MVHCATFGPAASSRISAPCVRAPTGALPPPLSASMLASKPRPVLCQNCAQNSPFKNRSSVPHPPSLSHVRAQESSDKGHLASNVPPVRGSAKVALRSKATRSLLYQHHAMCSGRTVVWFCVCVLETTCSCPLITPKLFLESSPSHLWLTTMEALPYFMNVYIPSGYVFLPEQSKMIG